ncbi:MAG TPA: hypothetical protein VGM92_01210 [Candidatus Kapabacteria bacterium]|jgi:hypothetical protein
MQFTELFLESTAQEYRRRYAARPYDASAYLREVADHEAVSVKTLHKHLGLGLRKSREKSIECQARLAEIDSYTRMIWEFSVNHSYDLNKISVAVSFDHLMGEKHLPESLTIKQVYESMRRQRLRNHSAVTWKKIPENRKPMDTWQMDFSKSRYFKHVVSGDGEIQCVKPIATKRQDDGVSLYMGLAIDMASRVMYVKYYLATGENADSVIEFILAAFDSKAGTFHLQGVPRSAYIDNGPGWTAFEAKAGMKKLGVAKIFGGFEKDVHGNKLPKRNKQGRGQIERTVNTIKNRMEAALFLKLGAGKKLYISDLNAALSDWLEEWNQGPHPMHREESKMNMFLAHSGNSFENLSFPPEDARAFFSRSIMRTVDRGKVLVKPKTYAFAPAIVDDGEEVEIVKNQNGYYIFKNGELHKLTLEGAPEPIHEPRAGNFATETKNAKLAEMALRKRFDEELISVLGTTLHKLNDDEWNDIAPFFEQPRSVEEIEEKVAWMAMARRLATEAPVRMPSNIIQLPAESFIRKDSI